MNKKPKKKQHQQPNSRDDPDSDTDEDDDGDNQKDQQTGEPLGVGTAGKEIVFDSDFFGAYHKIKINKFIPGISPEMSIFSTITVYGKRKSGKSVFCKWFLQAYAHEVPWAWVFTLTKFNSFYGTFLPEKFVMTSFSADALKAIMKRQEIAMKMQEKQVAEGHPNPVNPRAVIVWDDYMGKDIRFNRMLYQYYYTGRHYFTMNIFMTQHITETPPAIRSNTDFPVLFNTDYGDSVEHYWRDFAGKMDKKQFYQMFRETTCEPHTFLCINNDPNCNWDDKFYVGKADLLDADIRYVFGCEDYWKENQKQLEQILSGKMQSILDLRSKMAEHHPRDNEVKTIPEFVSEVEFRDKSKLKMHSLPQIKDKDKFGDIDAFVEDMIPSMTGEQLLNLR